MSLVTNVVTVPHIPLVSTDGTRPFLNFAPLSPSLLRRSFSSSLLSQISIPVCFIFQYHRFSHPASSGVYRRTQPLRVIYVPGERPAGRTEEVTYPLYLHLSLLQKHISRILLRTMSDTATLLPALSLSGSCSSDNFRRTRHRPGPLCTLYSSLAVSSISP